MLRCSSVSLSAQFRVGAGLPDVEGNILMAARRLITNKLRDAYRKAGKRDKARILDEVMNTTGMSRSTVWRMLTGSRLPDPVEQIDRRRLPTRRSMRLRGISTTAPSPLLRNWIGLSKAGGEPATVAG